MTSRRIAACLSPWVLALGPLALAAVAAVGSQGCSSKSSGGLSGDDEGEGGASSGGSGSGGGSSGTGSSSGSSSGKSSGSGGGATSSGSGRVASNIQFTDAGVPLCANTPCNLTSNTCCVTLNQTGSCIPQSQSCSSQEAQFKCLQASDCPSGQVCCGVANNTAGAASAGSQCQDIAAAGHCDPVATGASSTMGSAQLCQTDAECVNKMSCVWQVCSIMTTIDGVEVPLMPNLTMCGIQSAAPFNCAAHQ